MPAPSADQSVRHHADFSFTELVEAYFDCRKNKRNTASALEFERDLERNLARLNDELADGSYSPGRSICFVVTRPKAREVWAADFRKRLFMVMRRDGIAIRWPAPTHGKRGSAEVNSGKLKPFLSAAGCIDWSIPTKSIFERKKPLAPATLRRIGKGYERYVKGAAEPYIVETGHGQVAAHITKFNTGSVGHAADEPLATITSGAGAERPAGAAHGLGLVVASLVQYYSGGGQNLPADGPMPAIVTKDRVGVTCAFLAKHFKGVVGASVEAPMPTVTTVDHNSVVTAHLIGIDNQSSGGAAWDVTNPLNTITVENRHALVTSNLIKLRGTSSEAGTDEPLGTVSAGGQRHAEVRTTFARTAESIERREQVRAFLREFCPSLKDAEQPELVMIKGELMEVVDIGLRMLVPRELANAQGFPRDYILDPFYTSINKRGKTVTKRLSGSAQVRMIGNSVSPPPAIAALRANNHELRLARAAA